MKYTNVKLIGLVLAAVFTICNITGCDDNSTSPSSGKKQFVVAFNVNGGEPGFIAPVTIDSGAVLGTSYPSNPTRTNYTFGGWFEGTTQYTAATAITKNVTLTANWTANQAVSTFTDTRDGKTYKSVKIGNRTWMAENLNFEVNNHLPQQYSYCYQDNDRNCSTHGRLYNWAAAMVACPSGWRLSTNQDWTDLVQAVGGASTGAKKLKSSTEWDGTDEFNFSALGGGHRTTSSGPSPFANLHNQGNWWTSVEINNGEANYWYMNRSFDDVRGPFIQNKGFAYSVRCVQN